MARLIYARQALEDLERLTHFLLESDPKTASETFSLIEEAVDVLQRHPLIGRPAAVGLRELVISRGQTGYVALYSYELDEDAVLVLAIRYQREVGYPPDD